MRAELASRSLTLREETLREGTVIDDWNPVLRKDMRRLLMRRRKENDLWPLTTEAAAVAERQQFAGSREEGTLHHAGNSEYSLAADRMAADEGHTANVLGVASAANAVSSADIGIAAAASTTETVQKIALPVASLIDVLVAGP
ncbi:hypothetical protein ABW20_dc0106142 [Dactylellina cionopaga]|nr:hypothetical protein ABW20_dc0106142 [Dactylellina cionopaga]